MARITKGGIIAVRRGRRVIYSYPGGHRSIIRYPNAFAALIAYWTV